ncbi:MAG: histidinol dehydrogenase [Pseudobdellovibrionaceae bacterium]|jgi:histidinol dehydrogenase|nr:histidinol dehydrogenase [Pseudobdellovibrionaceae bacterium]
MLFFRTEGRAEFVQEFVKLSRVETVNPDIKGQVATIIEDVRMRGDSAIMHYARKFDGMDLKPEDFLIDLTKVDADSLPLSKKEKDSIRFAFERIYDFACRTKPKDCARGLQGYVAQKYVPFDRVACYVPSGSFPLVSTTIHTCAFAKAAGVRDITIITSPKVDGVHPAILYAAKIVGATRILQCGGVYGVAAVTFGTEIVQPVQFIAGPGNAYVTEAKKQVFGTVGIDMLAGPSEIMVIADETADVRYVAADLLSQAEHGSGMEQAVLATTSQNLFDTIENEILKQCSVLPESSSMDRVIERGIFVIRTENLDECVEICNAYAPEHVELLTAQPEILEPKITSAGAIMMGEWTPEPIGDFVAGSSHVLPTGGAAQIFSGLNTAHFMKKISVQNFTKQMLEATHEAAEEFARMESLPAHGRSVSIRFDN